MSKDALQPSGISVPVPAITSTTNASTALAAPAITTAAVRAPRENALRHGLTADALIEQVIGDEVYRALVDSLVEEFDAQGAIELALVRRIAQELAALDLTRYAELAALREGVRRHNAFGAPCLPPAAAQVPEGDLLDAPLSSALASDALDRVLRYGRSHERGLLATLSKLRELSASRQRPPLTQPLPASADAPAVLLGRSPAAFAELVGDDAACEEYLLDRLRSVSYRCPSCGAGHGYWLASRRRCECHACHRQAGARSGTVMAGSPLRLSVWFKAIGLIIQQPELSAPALAAALGIRRLSTVRGILRKLRVALASPERSRLLAGLDQLLAQSSAPETGAPETGIFRNGPPRAAADALVIDAGVARRETDGAYCHHPS